MSRSGYTDDHGDGYWPYICWQGAVKSALRGRRGQAFLREMLEAMDALPEKRLVREELVCEDGVCALGAVAVKRALDVSEVDPEEYESVAHTFGIAEAMAREIVFLNDDYFNDDYFNDDYFNESPEARFVRMRAWVVKNIREPQP